MRFIRTHDCSHSNMLINSEKVIAIEIADDFNTIKNIYVDFGGKHECFDAGWRYEDKNRCEFDDLKGLIVEL